VVVEAPYAYVTLVKYITRGNDMSELYFMMERVVPEYKDFKNEQARALLKEHEDWMNVAYWDGYQDGKDGKSPSTFEEHRKRKEVR